MRAFLACRILQTTLLAFAIAVPAAADTPPGTDAGGSMRTADPCTFYRGRAYRKPISHFATEMLWACEAIALRRTAAQPLGDRLEAAEAALEAYREAVVAASVAALRAMEPPRMRMGLSEEETRALAEESGALAALDTIRSGF